VAGPGWLTGILTAAMLLTAGYCVARLIAAHFWHRRTEYDIDAAHALMGVAMAGMLMPALNPLGSGDWTVVFVIAVTWFAGQAIQAQRTRRTHEAANGHHLAHVLSCGTMVYMLVAARSVAAAQTHAQPATAMAARPPGVTLVLACVMVGYVVWTTDQLTTLPSRRAIRAVPIRASTTQASTLADSPSMIAVDSWPSATDRPRSVKPEPATRLPLSPRLAACCQIAMGITMGYMLIQIL
jgi:hypothetical protein